CAEEAVRWRFANRNFGNLHARSDRPLGFAARILPARKKQVFRARKRTGKNQDAFAAQDRTSAAPHRIQRLMHRVSGGVLYPKLEMQIRLEHLQGAPEVN